MTYRLGIIGAGTIGRLHAESASDVGVIIAGCFDTDRAKAQSLVESHPGAVATGALDELLALPDLPAVVVAVPNHLHKDLAIQALRAGKHVLLEKPMALSAAECDEIIAAARGADRLVELGFVCRHAPAVVAVRRFIDAGRFGRIYHARAQLYRQRGIPGLGGWFTTRAESGGGVLIDLGVHLIDLLLHLTGRPAARLVSGVCTSTFGAPIEEYVYTEMWAGPPRPEGTFDVEDGASALIRCDGGLTMEVATTWAANVPEDVLPGGVLLMGERAGCYLDVWRSARIITEEDGAVVEITPELPEEDAWARAWRAEHAAFAAAVRGRHRAAASMHEGRAVQAILDAIYRSSAAGREVEVEPPASI